MAEYRTPLPAMFAGLLEAGVNRVLALDPASADRVLRLQGKCLQLDLEGLEITLYLTFQSGNIRVSLDTDTEPDTKISGTPVALFAMAAPAETSNWGLPGSSVTISGDANLARDIERIFSRLEPDWQQPFSELLGDTAGFQVASGLKQGMEALKEAAEATIEMAGSYLRDESDMAVKPEELSEFSETVDALNDAVSRLEARIKNITEPDT